MTTSALECLIKNKAITTTFFQIGNLVRPAHYIYKNKGVRQVKFSQKLLKVV